MTRAELVSRLKRTDLSVLSKPELDSICQSLGLSARGTRQELIAKIRKAIR